MLPVVAASMIAAPVLAADEKSFFHIPGVEDFRVQRILRGDHERAWPFTVDEGFLSCAYVVGQRAVYFVEIMDDTTAQDKARVMIVSANPMDIILSNMMDGGLMQKSNDIAEMIRLLGPFQSIGQRLCDQPAGTTLGPGEL